MGNTNLDTRFLIRKNIEKVFAQSGYTFDICEIDENLELKVIEGEYICSVEQTYNALKDSTIILVEIKKKDGENDRPR